MFPGIESTMASSCSRRDHLMLQDQPGAGSSRPSGEGWIELIPK